MDNPGRGRLMRSLLTRDNMDLNKLRVYMECLTLAMIGGACYVLILGVALSKVSVILAVTTALNSVIAWKFNMTLHQLIDKWRKR